MGEKTYEFDPGRAIHCAICKVKVETDILPLNACSEHKAQVAKLNKEKMAAIREKKGG
jgi:hypothetical protein